MESKVIVFEFSKEFADNSIDFAYHCKSRFSLSIRTCEELKGHNVLIRSIEDLVIGNIVKVRVIYERYRLDEEFFVPHNNPMDAFTYTFDFNTTFQFNTSKWSYPNS